MTLPIARDLAKQGIRVVTIAPGLYYFVIINTLLFNLFITLICHIIN